MNEKYLFLAIPPYSGSTVMHNYLAECSAVAKLVQEDSLDPNFIEGNGIVDRKFGPAYYVGGSRLEASLPGYFIEFNQAEINYNFNLIKTVWDKNWETNYPDRLIRLQKTPGDVYRVQIIQKYFRNAKWIISVRNPYAWAMSTIQKLANTNNNPVEHFDKICTHITNTYYVQKENDEFLGDKAYTVTFEDLVANPELHAEGIRNFVPELTDFTFNKEVWVKKKLYNGLESNNDIRIQKLKEIPGLLDKLNNHLKDHTEILNYWDYNIIE